ncbi:MAG: hypothetical protein HKM89_09910 [Gemmatimonadales bacterium]|nr:hypothetical protein [Gemmatimonadales bacterium]
MTSLGTSRWAVGLALAFGVAYLGACASDTGPVTDPGTPSFGQRPPDAQRPGDGVLMFELFEICKVFVNAPAGTPDAVFDVTVSGGTTASFSTSLGDGECEEIWGNGGTVDDLVTVTEQALPVPAGGGSWATTHDMTTITGVFPGTPGPSSSGGNTASAAFSGGLGATTLSGVLVVFTNTFTPPDPPGDEGCTPGFWRNWSANAPGNQSDEWTDYAVDDDYDTVFGVVSGLGTLYDAVTAKGGGENALGRHSVAALLNATHPDVAASLSEAEVIQLVQDAFSSGDFETAKNTLAAANELGCPLPVD